ncbi:PaaX family transcriptional regulator C-terminal domain-containing protein [Pontiellaceae bacterium B1224]|nr:PaaX family transcriptional regulator C-terminal domain-containing protein [Pontiellaceae bacterium B1224]
MNWKNFHHPDWSLPVVRRRAQEEWLDFVSDLGDLIATGGRSEFWKHTYPNLRAYHNSMSRLRKAGLLVHHHDDGKLPHLKLTEQGHNFLPNYLFPEKLWNTHWNQIWYTLIFDVPEKERHYRDTLRGFLKRLRMGCLQKSVWITPRDIRPEYDDLEQAANIHAVSYLFESRTVLHHETEEMVLDAWNFDHLSELHERYMNVFNSNLQRLEETDHDPSALMILLRNEAEAYIQCMRSDPLLPNELLPKGYLGKDVYQLRKQIRSAIRLQLKRHII